MILDLFAGIGWAEGLRTLGLQEVGIELDPAVCETRHAAGHHNTIRADVAAYPITTLPGRVAGLIASPPCQAFSRAGKRLGMRDLPALYELVEQIRRTSAWVSPAGRRWHDDRSPLVLEPLRFAGAILPAWIALEQIPDVLPLWRRYAHILERWGYRTWSAVLNTADYGVPQTRERAILMAVRGGSVRPPEPTHCDQRRGGSLLGMAPWVSMADALGWHGELDPLINSTMGGGKIKRYYRTTERPSPTVRGCADRWVLHTNRDQREDGSRQTRTADQPAPTVTAEVGASEQWRIVMGNQDNATHRTVGEPAPTVLCGHRVNDIRWTRERPVTTVQADTRIGRPGHKNRDQGEAQFEQDAVRVTLDEIAILQGFPAGYPWQGNKSQRASQIGNAVPPPLAAAIVGVLTGSPPRKEAA